MVASAHNQARPAGTSATATATALGTAAATAVAAPKTTLADTSSLLDDNPAAIRGRTTAPRTAPRPSAPSSTP